MARIAAGAFTIDSSPPLVTKDAIAVRSPKFFNAFEFILPMSLGFDLSSLFETKQKARSLFTSKCLATAITPKIEEHAKGLSFKVASL
ncbi:hypothetical protein NL676_035187 [Syzygium grande]|nr:hypothetical protein NL676_035187 [Syzygium grande]